MGFYKRVETPERIWFEKHPKGYLGGRGGERQRERQREREGGENGPKHENMRKDLLTLPTLGRGRPIINSGLLRNYLKCETFCCAKAAFSG